MPLRGKGPTFSKLNCQIAIGSCCRQNVCFLPLRPRKGPGLRTQKIISIYLLNIFKCITLFDKKCCPGSSIQNTPWQNREDGSDLHFPPLPQGLRIKPRLHSYQHSRRSALCKNAHFCLYSSFLKSYLLSSSIYSVSPELPLSSNSTQSGICPARIFRKRSQGFCSSRAALSLKAHFNVNTELFSSFAELSYTIKTPYYEGKSYSVGHYHSHRLKAYLTNFIFLSPQILKACCK